MEGKGRAEIRGFVGKVTMMVADASTMDSLGKNVWNIQWMGDGSWNSGGIAGCQSVRDNQFNSGQPTWKIFQWNGS